MESSRLLGVPTPRSNGIPGSHSIRFGTDLRVEAKVHGILGSSFVKTWRLIVRDTR